MSGGVWDLKGAKEKAAEKSAPIRLVRADGSSSGLVVTAAGDLRREASKPKGKAARKEFKKIKRQLRDLASSGTSPTSQRILVRRLKNLCPPSTP